MPKYSIIIPSKNGLKYLPTCIESIVRQDYSDYELIVSDDRSNDGTKDYLKQLSTPNTRILEPPHAMGMAEHWEWALSQATGNWLIFVGQDDGLQPYFFQLADSLTSLAEKHTIRAIMSKRAYYFWPGCEDVYGQCRVNYSAINEVSLCNCSFQLFRTLLGSQNYFELPEMYTTSLFNRDLLDEVRRKQNGKVFVTHPQDANLAAIACRLEKRYLRSEIPLGWVGSSPKSAGLAMSTAGDTENSENASHDSLLTLKSEYKQNIINSDLRYSPLAGDFSFSSCIIYLWQSLLQTQHLNGFPLDVLIFTQFFKLIMFGQVVNEMKITQLADSEIAFQFKNLLKINNCSYKVVIWASQISIPKPLYKLLNVILSPYQDVKSKPQGRDVIKLQYQSIAGDEFDIDLLSVSEQIEEMVSKATLMEKSHSYIF